MLLVAGSAGGCARPAPPVEGPDRSLGGSAATRALTTEELVRIRCSLDGAEVLVAWSGEVFAFVPDQRPRHVFGVEGLNVARCVQRDGRWHLTSRELMVYLDPETRAPLERWANPWTGASVPVVHVANRLVQNDLTGPVPATTADGEMTLAFDIPLAYPNPLARDPATARFSPAATYVASEFFTFSAPSAAALDPGRPAVSRLDVDWYRIGPWLPWMDMGDRSGHLVYRAHGRKLHAAADLPATLRATLTTVPLYRHAPDCVVDARNETSWTYFARHLPAYLAGARFPQPEVDTGGECSPATPPATGAQRPPS